jgi:putative chitinase
MTILLSGAQISSILPGCQDPNGWATAISNTFSKWNITTLQQIAAFIAQCAVESAQFNETIENLNYGAAGLMAVFPHEFQNATIANQYARNPEAIANVVYAPPRLGNSLPGDGWYLRGRGLIQISGRTNYQAFATTMNFAFDDAVAYATTQQGAADCAGWYWYENSLNQYCTDNENDFINLTKKINGSTTDIQQRESFWEVARQVLGA